MNTPAPQEQGSALGSIVVPARNEAAVIARTLRALFDGLDPSVEVVVVCLLSIFTKSVSFFENDK